MSSSPATVALARLISSYTLSAYKLFVPLPSLTAKDLSNMRSVHYSELYNAFSPSIDVSTLTKALARLMSSYMLSIYALFVHLPSLTARDLANMRSTHYSEIYHSVPFFMHISNVTKPLAHLLSSYMLSIYALFVRLPSLSADDIARMRSTHYSDINNSLPQLVASTNSAIYNIFANPESPESTLPWIPRPIKYVLLGLLILNCRSFPLNWHIRVWRPLYWLIARYPPNAWRSHAEIVRRWDLISPIGANPLDEEAHWQSWASPDECDHTLEFHDSSYAKTWDSARFKDIMEQYNRLLMDGGRLAVAGTHFEFIKPIPMMAKYRIKSKIIAWDEKWIYTMAKFVSHPPEKKAVNKTINISANKLVINNDEREREHQHQAQKPIDLYDRLGLLPEWLTESEEEVQVLNRPITSPSTSSPLPSALPFMKFNHDVPLSATLGTFRMGSGSDGSETSEPSTGASTPSLYNGSSSSYSSSSSTSVSGDGDENDDEPECNFEDLEDSDDFSEPTLESDGSTLHCVALSRCCWKYSRITVPPAIALTSVGYGLTTEQWLRVRAMRDRGQMKKFLKGGWKDVKEGDRWWEEALGKPEIDERRRRNLEVVMRMREGLEGAGRL